MGSAPTPLDDLGEVFVPIGTGAVGAAAGGRAASGLLRGGSVVGGAATVLGSVALTGVVANRMLKELLQAVEQQTEAIRRESDVTVEARLAVARSSRTRSRGTEPPLGSP